jgi:hypothetical protein
LELKNTINNKCFIQYDNKSKKKIWKIKSQVPNKKDEENIAPEIDEVNNRSLKDKTSNKEYSQKRIKKLMVHIIMMLMMNLRK